MLVSYVISPGIIRTLMLRLPESALVFEDELDSAGLPHWRPEIERVPAAAQDSFEEVGIDRL